MKWWAVLGVRKLEDFWWAAKGRKKRKGRTQERTEGKRGKYNDWKRKTERKKRRLLAILDEGRKRRVGIALETSE